MNVEAYIEHLKNSPSFMKNVTEWRVLPPREAKYADFPEGLDARLVEALARRGVKRPYSHQRLAIDAALAGEDLVVVTPTASGKTNGRTLYCPQCGATWEVERIRCVRCGTQDESQLHYRSIEGDDAHRIHVCDRCKGYVRTRFADETGLAPFVPEVEDVVAADLGMGPQAQGR